MNTVSQTTRGHSIVPKFAANLTMLFNELSFFDRFAAAKATGFTGVEYLFPYDFEKALLGELLQQYGLTQVLHNLPAGNWGRANVESRFYPTAWRNSAMASGKPSIMRKRSTAASSTASSASCQLVQICTS